MLIKECEDLLEQESGELLDAATATLVSEQHNLCMTVSRYTVHASDGDFHFSIVEIPYEHPNWYSGWDD